MRKVVIATPALDGRVEGIYAYALAETVRLGMVQGVYFMPLLVMNDALLPNARNDLLAIVASQKDIDGILWIDSDHGWNPADALKIIAHGEDVVGATARRKHDDEAYNVKAKREKLVANEKGLMPVEGIGCGFLYLSQKVVRHLWAKRPKVWGMGSEQRRVFEVTYDSQGNMTSEDMHMTLGLAKDKFKLWIDPSINLAHVGKKAWNGNFLNFLARLNEAVAAQPPPVVPSNENKARRAKGKKKGRK